MEGTFSFWREKQNRKMTMKTRNKNCLCFEHAQKILSIQYIPSEIGCAAFNWSEICLEYENRRISKTFAKRAKIVNKHTDTEIQTQTYTCTYASTHWLLIIMIFWTSQFKYQTQKYLKNRTICFISGTAKHPPFLHPFWLFLLLFLSCFFFFFYWFTYSKRNNNNLKMKHTVSKIRDPDNDGDDNNDENNLDIIIKEHIENMLDISIAKFEKKMFTKSNHEKSSNAKQYNRFEFNKRWIIIIKKNSNTLA